MVATVIIVPTYFWLPFVHNPLNPSKIFVPIKLLTDIFIKYQLWSLHCDKHQTFPHHLKYFYCSEILIFAFVYRFLN